MERRRASVEETVRAAARVRERLAAALSPDGGWRGELSESALSTATAVAALALVDPARGAERIARGLAWLAERANPDGGWGDTVRSRSNPSTTALAWSAFAAAGPLASPFERSVRGAEAWLSRAAGSLAPAAIAEAIAARYGRDRTFSAPILALAAASGRLGEGPEAWRHVLPLPFELAAFPRRWFAALRLPVVSYAIPALVAIGLARSENLPARNPLARALRRVAAPRALRVLEEIQPSSGGFLEATPLTSFVAIGLAAAGRRDHPVARRAVEFLLASVRADGGWAIEADLATWLTTLAANALAAHPDGLRALGDGVRSRIAERLLASQHAGVHPYTLAPPGGWAWTDLPGGVPDADDTAGAVLALARLAPRDEPARRAAARGIEFLLRLQNRDGGVPTFARGWGLLPFDRSAPDLTAHALRAFAAWRWELEPGLARRVDRAARRAVRYLERSQREDGAWIPLWFGNERAPGEENPTYGTSRVLLGLAEAEARLGIAARDARRRALEWLLRAEDGGGGWGGAPGVPPSTEETAVAVEALAASSPGDRSGGADAERVEAAVERGARFLAETALEAEPAPIGLYFARLWYFERLYPLVFAAGALGAATRARLTERQGMGILDESPPGRRS